jgi:hypothetical protein
VCHPSHTLVFALSILETYVASRAASADEQSQASRRSCSSDARARE